MSSQQSKGDAAASSQHQRSNSTPQINEQPIRQALPKIQQAESRQMQVGFEAADTQLKTLRRISNQLQSNRKQTQEITNTSLGVDQSYLRQQQNRLDHEKTYQHAQHESMSRTGGGATKINNLFSVGASNSVTAQSKVTNSGGADQSTIAPALPEKVVKQNSNSKRTSMSTTNKSEIRLKNSQSQFMQLADRLLGNVLKNSQSNAAIFENDQEALANGTEYQEVKQAMKDANGYNLVSSKSTKVLPLTSKRHQQIGHTKNATAMHLKTQKLYKVGDNVQNILAREQIRDGKLANRLKIINNKQAARIREIENQELEKQQEELHKIVAGDGTIEAIEKQFLQGARESLQQQQDAADSRQVQMPDVHSNTVPVSKTEKQSLGPAAGAPSSSVMNLHEGNSGSKVHKHKFYSNGESKGMSKSQSMSIQKLMASHQQSQNREKEEVGQDDANQSYYNLHNRGQTSQQLQQKQDNTWNLSKSQLPLVNNNNNTGGKSRPDVSFLQEKVTTLVSQNAATKKMALDTTQGLLLSQSQLTSGNEGRDDYLQVALGLRQIGKSIMDMPKNLDDLRLLSREYMKNLGITDELADEQVYLAYIEDNLKQQQSQTAHDKSALSGNVSSSGIKQHTSHLSPIRNLADFYQRKLNKIESHNTGEMPSVQAQISQFLSPKLHSRVSNNQTYVDIEKMTVLDLEKLEQSPPRINPRRKNMKVVNNRAMTEFGSEAFNVDLGQVKQTTSDGQEAHRMTRLQKVSSLERLQSVAEDLKSVKKPALDQEKVGTSSISPIERKPVKFLNSNSQTGINSALVKKEERNIKGKKHLLQSLNDLADQLTKPSIQNEDKDKPQWLQKDIKEEAARIGLPQSNLGKPSSRQDAILLANWFKGIIDMIEMEHQNSKAFFSKQGPKKTFPTQRVHENEISQTDSYLLIQIAHNIAIKEITRQVSVQCIERGILLKTIFDSYVRMVDLIFVDSVAQRKLLAQKFANVCERQVFFQTEQIRAKDQVIERKEKEIAMLREELEWAQERETSLKFTNKKLAAISNRAQNRALELERQNMSYHRQMEYLNKSMQVLIDQVEPDRAAILKKEKRKVLKKIQTQADIDHIQIQNSKRQSETGEGELSELQIVAGEIIKTREYGTDLDDFGLYLEELNGGPLQLEIEMQTSLKMDEVSNSQFDLYEVGAIEDKGTMIDEMWRRQTRAKPLKRAASQVNKKTAKLDQRLEAMDDMSFETSSHATLDYLLEKEMTKSFTFGFGRRYMHHLKMPRPKKRTLSAASFNWNLLVDRIDGRLELEAQENAKLNSGTPMVKLTEILGADLLTRIKNELPELYEQLMEHISNKQTITYAFCRMLLNNYNINLDYERKQQRLKFGKEYMDQLNMIGMAGGPDGAGGANMNDSTERGDGDYSELLAGNASSKRKVAKTGSRKKEDRGFQFAEWNFLKRTQNRKKERYRKDHPSFPIVTRLLERFKAGKDIKDTMPVKGCFRVIHQVYLKKAEDLKMRTVSPDPAGAEATGKQSTEDVAISKKVSTMSPKQLKVRRTSSEPRSPDGSQHNAAQGEASPNQRPAGIGTVPTKRNSAEQQAERGQNVATSTNMCEFVYEYFQNRYGLKAAGEKKFSQFIGAMLKYREKHSRFQLFGRFLELYDELSEDDIRLYMDILQVMYKTVLNFQIFEHDEIILIPTPRALDFFRMTLVQRLTQTSMTSCLRLLRKKQVPVQKIHAEKHPHLKLISEAIPLDDFAEFVIQTTNQLQAEKLQNIVDIFSAVDLDGNGLIGFNELRTLHRLLCSQAVLQSGSGDTNQMMQECRMLFNEYAQVFTDVKGSEGLKVRGISYDQFEKMCLEKDIFTIRQQNQFINIASKTFLNVTEAPQKFNNEFAKVSANLDRIYERLTEAVHDMMDTQVVSDNDKLRYLDMLDQMVKAVMNPVNKKVAFLAFKIVEETIKRMVLKAQTEKLMPFKPLTITLCKTALKSAMDDSKSRESVAKPLSVSQRNAGSVSPKTGDHVKLINFAEANGDQTSKTAAVNAQGNPLVGPFAKSGPIAADFSSQASSRNQLKAKRLPRMTTFQATGTNRKINEVSDKIFRVASEPAFELQGRSAQHFNSRRSGSNRDLAESKSTGGFGQAIHAATASQGFTPQNAQAFPGKKIISTVISKGSAHSSTHRNEAPQ